MTSPPIPDLPQERIAVGISSCLLGEEVRYDGGHKRDAYINGTLADYFDFVPVCPEVAIGLGTPRQPIRLIREKGDSAREARVQGVRDPELDVTDELAEYGRAQAAELTGIHGYIFKRASPSCGMERVKVFTPDGHPAGKDGVGAYAAAFMAQRPDLPVEEEGRLGDPGLRDAFIERVFIRYRWQYLVDAGLTAGGLVAFHSRHKLLIMAHNQSAYRELGRMVANAGNEAIHDLGQRYLNRLMAAIAQPAPRSGHANVLYHLMGYLKEALDSEDKTELGDVIERYRTGQVPLVVPITLLNHHFRRHPDPYVAEQVYMQPHPDELGLRNQI